MSNIQHEEDSKLLGTEESMQNALKLIRKMTKETIEDIPLAVDEIFDKVDVDKSEGLSMNEWLNAWHQYQELLDMCSLKGVSKLVSWASVILTPALHHSRSVCMSTAPHLCRAPGEPDAAHPDR